MTTGRRRIKGLLAHAVVIIAVGAVLIWRSAAPEPNPDQITFEGESYVPVEYSGDIFYYDLHFSADDDMVYEEDVKYPLEGSQGSMIYCNGDLYCLEDRAEQAKAYYADDENYEWFVTVETEERTETKPVTLSEEERAYLYEAEDMEKDLSIFVDEIQAFGTLMKVSEDGVIEGRTELAYYGDTWYWRSEVINEEREEDGTWPEYVYPLPERLASEIGPPQ